MKQINKQTVYVHFFNTIRSFFLSFQKIELI